MAMECEAGRGSVESAEATSSLAVPTIVVVADEALERHGAPSLSLFPLRNVLIRKNCLGEKLTTF